MEQVIEMLNKSKIEFDWNTMINQTYKNILCLSKKDFKEVDSLYCIDLLGKVLITDGNYDDALELYSKHKIHFDFECKVLDEFTKEYKFNDKFIENLNIQNKFDFIFLLKVKLDSNLNGRIKLLKKCVEKYKSTECLMNLLELYIVRKMFKEYLETDKSILSEEEVLSIDTMFYYFECNDFKFLTDFKNLLETKLMKNIIEKDYSFKYECYFIPFMKKYLSLEIPNSEFYLKIKKEKLYELIVSDVNNQNKVEKVFLFNCVNRKINFPNRLKNSFDEKLICMFGTKEILPVKLENFRISDKLKSCMICYENKIVISKIECKDDHNFCISCVMKMQKKSCCFCYNSFDSVC